MGERTYPKYSLNEESFKKAVLILQLTRIEPMTITKIREETKIGNADRFVDMLLDMGYLEVVGKKSKRDGIRTKQTKYRATYRFQKIVGGN